MAKRVADLSQAELERRRQHDRGRWSRAPHRDRRAYHVAYDAAHAAEKRAYRAAHRPDILAYHRAWWAANRDELNAQKAAYNATHRSGDVERHHRRRVRKAGNGLFVVRERDWRRMLDRYRHACAYCGAAGIPLHREHVVPIARGGRHSIGNLLPSCSLCNARKGAKFLIEWRAELLRAAA